MNKKFQTKHISDYQVCISTETSNKNYNKICECLSKNTGYPVKVCAMAIERALKRGLLLERENAYGVSYLPYRVLWLTELGEFTIWLHDVTKANKGFMLDLAYGYWKMLKKDGLNNEKA
jgi:hypothetical protein